MALDRKVARANKAKALAKFSKIAALNSLQDKGEPVGKDKRKLSDAWEKRVSNNVSGTFNRKHSKPGACIITKG